MLRSINIIVKNVLITNLYIYVFIVLFVKIIINSKNIYTNKY